MGGNKLRYLVAHSISDCGKTLNNAGALTSYDQNTDLPLHDIGFSLWTHLLLGYHLSDRMLITLELSLNYARRGGFWGAGISERGRCLFFEFWGWGCVGGVRSCFISYLSDVGGDHPIFKIEVAALGG